MFVSEYYWLFVLKLPFIARVTLTVACLVFNFPAENGDVHKSLTV